MELDTPPSTDPIAELAKTMGIVLWRNDIENAAFVVVKPRICIGYERLTGQG
jgi:hypothetical protein